MENIINTIVDYYNTQILSDVMYEQTENAGGKVRQKNGNLVENMVKIIIEQLCKSNNISDYKITGKSEDSVRIPSKNGYIDASVDVHMSINNKSILFSECKTYLDKCYLDRANSDLLHFKKLDKSNSCIIVSLENAVSSNAESYFLDEGNIDKIFYLVDGKRRSSNPIWKSEFYKPINIDVIKELINHIDNIIKQHI